MNHVKGVPCSFYSLLYSCQKETSHKSPLHSQLENAIEIMTPPFDPSNLKNIPPHFIPSPSIGHKTEVIPRKSMTRGHTYTWNYLAISRCSGLVKYDNLATCNLYSKNMTKTLTFGVETSVLLQKCPQQRHVAPCFQVIWAEKVPGKKKHGAHLSEDYFMGTKI